MATLTLIAKAITGSLVAGLGALQVALPAGVSGAEWIGVALASLATFGFVWVVPNTKPAE